MTNRRSVFLAWGLVAGGFILAYARVVASLARAWWTDDNASHGFLIVPIALYFMWERRRRLAGAVARPTAIGLVVVVGSLGVLAAGVLGSELFLTRISMLGALAGILLFLYGWETLRIALFPLAFMLLMVPLPAIVFNQVAFPLQLLASRAGEAALGSVDIPVLREGNVLVLANIKLEVAEACSGIRSLVSLLTLGVVLGYFSDERRWVRTAIALSSIPVAIVANAARVAGTGIAAHRFGAAAAQGFLHEFSGWVVFVVALALMLALQRLMLWMAPAPRRVAAIAEAA
jgi:exosortase